MLQPIKLRVRAARCKLNIATGLLDGMVGARRAIASRVGATVVGGREMRAAADDRGQLRAAMQARDDCRKMKIS